uniref:Ankyrin repeat domain-containing protein 50 n=1 Tax=Cacopsylla melanoneura TaxID=428564 RepID=A0A8D8S2F0_9HEMI
MTSDHSVQSKKFFCREWAFVKLVHCLESKTNPKPGNNGGALIIGGPGSGKTTLCKEIVFPSAESTSSQQHCLRNKLLAYHFCQSYDLATFSVNTFIHSLVEQFSSSDSPFSEAFSSIVQDESIASLLKSDQILQDADDVFKKALILPLAQIKHPKTSYFILVDSIDEAHITSKKSYLEKSSSSIADLLARNYHLFPPWLFLFCTVRRQSKSIKKMFLGFHKLSLDDLRKSHVIRDMQQYILLRLASEESLRVHMNRDTAEMLNQLHIKSNGCFLYLERVLDGISDGLIILREIKDIPGTLNGLYLWLSQRLLSTKQFLKIQPLLNIILSSLFPLTADDVFVKFSFTNPQITKQEYKKRLHLLRKIICVGTHESVILFHHSFSEWLLDVKHCTKRYLCSLNDGHFMHIAYLSQRSSILTPLEVYSLAYYLSRVEFHCNERLDSQFLATLWLMSLDLPEVDLSQYLDMDGKTLTLLASTGIISPVPCVEVKHVPSLEAKEVSDSPSSKSPVSTITMLDASNQSILHKLCAENNINMLKTFLKSCVELDLELEDNHGQTALNVAAHQGFLEAVQILLEAGANINHTDVEGWTSLRSAAWGGHSSVVKLLLDSGADVNCSDMGGRTALRAAAWGGHLEVVKLLLAGRANVNDADSEGRTALIASAYMGHADIVSAILEYDADINQQDNDGRTALSVAALCVPSADGYAKVVNILLEKGAKVDHEDKEGMTPLLVAAFEGHRDVCEILLENEADQDHIDKSGRTPLWAAASMGHAACVALLLFWGAYVDTIDAEGRTVLSVAAAQGNIDVVNQLLDRGLDEQHRDNCGWTPLHYAAIEGHEEVCRALLEAGAKVDQVDNDGRAPLILASQDGHLSLVEMFLDEYEANVNQKSHDGRTALRVAALEGHMKVVQCLLGHGADPNIKDADGRSTLYILALENRLPMAEYFMDPGRVDVECTDFEGRTALHVSAWQGHVEMVEILLRLGRANVNATDSENRTALHSAAWQGHAAIVNLLLQHKAIPDHACNQGATPLGIAAQEGHEACVRLLLHYGADPKHSDHCGRNAFRVAAKSGHDTVLRLLKQYADDTVSAHSSDCNELPVLVANDSPLASPESTAKRKSLMSCHSKSSSNHTNSTKSSHNEAPKITPLTFTQQLQLLTKGDKCRPLSSLFNRVQSPVYATPPHSPPEVNCNVQLTSSSIPSATDEHFSRDTHMRIILGNSKVGEKISKAASKASSSGLRLVGFHGRNSSNNSPHVATNSFQWKKETRL